jgi:hypothetical protein
MKRTTAITKKEIVIVLVPPAIADCDLNVMLVGLNKL